MPQNLNHHGMGVRGALAVAECLKVNDKIRSINLGDNWLGDAGCEAMAEVLAVNVTLTSLSLASNRIGKPGAQALASKLAGNVSLAELNLRGNHLDDRAALALATAVGSNNALTRLDLSYNHLGEEAGRAFGEMLTTNGALLELSLRWNGLGKKGGAALADGLRRNYLLNRIDLSWNGLGDEGSRTVSEVLQDNQSLTHLDISHNRINMDGALALAAGIESNKSLLELELGFNPMGMTQTKAEQQDLTGVDALVKAIRTKEALSQVGLTEIQEGASVTRGRASRFDPAHPAGHYVLDLARAWDLFLAEKLWFRMLEQKGETWANLTVDSAKVAIHGADGSITWQLPPRGVLEFDYVDWHVGLEVACRFELSKPSDHRLAAKLLERAIATDGEACTSTHLNNLPFGLSTPAAVPSSGVLRLVYVCTHAIDEVLIPIELDLASNAEREVCLELWKRELTTPLESWKDVQYNHVSAQRKGAPPPKKGKDEGEAEAEAAVDAWEPLDHSATWQFPEVRRARRRRRVRAAARGPRSSPAPLTHNFSPSAARPSAGAGARDGRAALSVRAAPQRQAHRPRHLLLRADGAVQVLAAARDAGHRVALRL